jgi:hypothetical protein
MDENPYQAPISSDTSAARSKSTSWAPLGWAILGFAIGTLVVARLILSNDLQVRLQGGAIYGGPVGALFGLAHGVHRRRQAG